MDLKELRKNAKERGLKGYSTLSKDPSKIKGNSNGV